MHFWMSILAYMGYWAKRIDDITGKEEKIFWLLSVNYYILWSDNIYRKIYIGGGEILQENGLPV